MHYISVNQVIISKSSLLQDITFIGPYSDSNKKTNQTKNTSRNYSYKTDQCTRPVIYRLSTKKKNQLLNVCIVVGIATLGA